MATTYGVKDLCERYGVGEHTVLGWIRRGEMKALNVSRRPGGRPKWRITQQALEVFELTRASCPNPPPAPRRRRRGQSAEVNYY